MTVRRIDFRSGPRTPERLAERAALVTAMTDAAFAAVAASSRPMLVREVLGQVQDWPASRVRAVVRRLVVGGQLLQIGQGHGARVATPRVMADYLSARLRHLNDA